MKSQNEDNKETGESFIEVKKTDKKNSPYQNIRFKIKRHTDKKAKEYSLDELEEEQMIRYKEDFNIIYHSPIRRKSDTFERDVNIALKRLVNVSWLSIHRVNTASRRREDRGLESTIDVKIEDLSNDFVKYFSLLNGKYATETEKFQQYIFESLINSEDQKDIFTAMRRIDAQKEKKELKSIFKLFKLNDESIIKKLDSYFGSFTQSISKYNNTQTINIEELSYIIGIRRIHSVVQEWSKLIRKQNSINEPKETFLKVINSLLQKKRLFVNEKNEIKAETDEEKPEPLLLRGLSSGEKQLLIILGQSLLQESTTHIYIADEPELSLHVEWQEKLVSSIKSINPNSQIIFATHSPDIVGNYGKSVIKIEEAIK